jgi:hypothetical protein
LWTDPCRLHHVDVAVGDLQLNHRDNAGQARLAGLELRGRVQNVVFSYGNGLPEPGFP